MTFDNCYLIANVKLANARDINSFNGSIFSYKDKHIVVLVAIIRQGIKSNKKLANKKSKKKR